MISLHKFQNENVKEETTNFEKFQRFPWENMLIQKFLFFNPIN